MDTLAIANTILGQLGGSRFVAMTGAKNATAFTRETGEAALSFQLPRGTARKAIRFVRVTLTAADDYTVEFLTGKLRVAASHEGIYADQLADLFESETGLYTRF